MGRLPEKESSKGQDIIQRYLAGERLILADELKFPNEASFTRAMRQVYGVKVGRNNKQADGAKTSCDREFTGDKGTITTKSANIKTIDEAMEYAQIDTNIWEPYKSKINSWEVTMGKDNTNSDKPETYTNWQVTVFLLKKAADVYTDSIRELIKEIPTLECPPQSDVITDGAALELCPFDAHIGKLAWGEETGGISYDLKIAREHFLSGVTQNIQYASSHKVSKIFYILGQDLMHTDGFIPVTPTSKNVLDVDSRFPKILAVAQAVTLEALYACLEVAPTEVIWIPGNHDIHTSLYLSEIVKQHFMNNKFLSVDNRPKQKKARLWGNLLVGWTHDGTRKQSNLINILPQFWPELWGKSKFREWHTGHKHTKAEWKFMPVMTEGGTIIRQIPTLSQIDAWHAENDFVSAVPATESFIWTQDTGVCAHYTVNIT